MAAKRDYYEVLGVSNSADEREIKKAYRKLAHEYHPDKTAGDKAGEELFKEASEAYAVLSDPDKRARYDRFGHAGLNEGPGGFSMDINDIFGDFFGDIFGQSRRRSRTGQSGHDLQHELTISFEESAFGGEKKISYKRQEACTHCEGTGCKPGTKPSSCQTCRGMGEVRVSQGFFAMAQTCPECRGSGQTIKDRCGYCKGSKQEVVTRELNVKIPAGIEDGMQMRLSGEGNGGLQGGENGDLYVLIRVKAHPLFMRQDNDIICEVPISFTAAALGDKIEVPTLEGLVEMQVPSGTQSGASFRLKHKGIVRLRSNGHSSAERGDQIVKVRVEVPKHLTAKQKDLLREFAMDSQEDAHPEGKSFWGKVKELFG